ncbi:MAG: Gfo/Idh/MocA family protein [Chthoniobacteraceae bacterium]
MSSPLNTCLIGVDGWADVHYSDLLRQQAKGAVRILGATIINAPDVPEKCARLRAVGCELFNDYKVMIDCLGAKTDLCFIPTGIHFHAPMTIAALRSGANVYVEKPAAATIQDVRAMQQCEEETGRFVAVGYQTMYAREALWMKQAILDGKIGAIQSIKSRGLWPRFDTYYHRNNWAGRLRNGDAWILDSPFNNAIAHQLNMICFLAGLELERTAELESIQAELYRARNIESPDTACMRILTRAKVPLYFFVTHSSQGKIDPEITVQGERGSIRWTFSTAQLTVGSHTETIPCETHQELRDSVMARLFRRVKDPSTFVCNLDIAAAQTLCTNGAHDSSPVHLIGPEFVLREPASHASKTIVAGLDDVIECAFATGKLFSELGVPWARPGRVVSLVDYTWFPGNSANVSSIPEGARKMSLPLSGNPKTHVTG